MASAHLQNVHLRLHHRSWLVRHRISDDGFGDSPASINLSSQLTMGLDNLGTTVSYRGLAEFGLSTRQAWDKAAGNLVSLATRPKGTCFFLRDAAAITRLNSAAIQVRAPGAPISAWLAHPRTFTVLNDHLREQVGGTVIYFLPSADCLVVAAASDTQREHLGTWLRTTAQDPIARGGELMSSQPLIYLRGFPGALTDTLSQPSFMAA